MTARGKAGAGGSAPGPVEVVAGIVVERGRVLVAQRHRNQSFPLLWEFPGGKIEPGEAPETALAREFEEELGVSVTAGEPYAAIEYAGVGGRLIRVTFYLARRTAGSPRAIQVEAVAWVPGPDLDRVDFIPANREIVKRLRTDLEGGGALISGPTS